MSFVNPVTGFSGVSQTQTWDNMGTQNGPESAANGPGPNDHIRLRSCDRMDIVAPVPTSVYRYYDKNNLLLYVGITSRGSQRNREHNGSKEWWQFVVRQEVEHHPHREAASQRERHLIRKFHPPFNTQHNPDHAEMRAIYLSTLASDLSPVDPNARRILAAVHHKMPLTAVAWDGATALFAALPEHQALAGTLTWDRPVALLAPKKVASLVSVETAGAQTVFGFRGPRRLPSLIGPAMHLKARSQKPLLIGIHEVRAEVAA